MARVDWKLIVLKLELVKLLIQRVLLFLLKTIACWCVIGTLSYNSTQRVVMDGSTNTWRNTKKQHLIHQR